jgi:glyoxylate reductase
MPFDIFTNTLHLPANLQALLVDRCKLHLWQGEETAAALLNTVTGFLLYGHYKINGAIMDRIPNLRVISNFGVGVDHINLADARARGIAVGNTPNLLNAAVADMAFALMLAAARNVVSGDRFARSPAFTHYDPNVMHGVDVQGATLGIVGMGNIGRQIARRALAFDMHVLYHNRRANLRAEAELGVIYAKLPDLLQHSDFVVLITPLTPETYHLIGREQLRMMKPTAILVNVARGGVVDHDALLEALHEKWIHAAALDVTEPEPLPRRHPLLQLENVVITPHLGSAATQTRQKMAQRTVDNLLAGLSGERLLSQIV